MSLTVEPWFTNDFNQRIFDRAILTLKDIDGSAFLDLFCEEHGLEKGAPGDFTSIDTTSYNRWHNRHWLEQAESIERTPENIRGLVCFDGNFIDDELPKKVNQTIESLNNLSN